MLVKQCQKPRTWIDGLQDPITVTLGKFTIALLTLQLYKSSVPICSAQYDDVNPFPNSCNIIS